MQPLLDISAPTDTLAAKPAARSQETRSANKESFRESFDQQRDAVRRAREPAENRENETPPATDSKIEAEKRTAPQRNSRTNSDSEAAEQVAAKDNADTAVTDAEKVVMDGTAVLPKEIPIEHSGEDSPDPTASDAVLVALSNPNEQTPVQITTKQQVSSAINPATENTLELSANELNESGVAAALSKSSSATQKGVLLKSASVSDPTAADNGLKAASLQFQVKLSEDATADLKSANSQNTIVQPETPKPVLQKTGALNLLGKQTSTSNEVFALGAVEADLSLDAGTEKLSGLATEALHNSTAQSTQSLLSTQMSSPQVGRMQMPVTIQFGHTEWAGQVAERAAMMAAQKLSTAELQLDPPELGPLQVKVSVSQEHSHASVTFVSANPQVRDALDQTVMRLRDLLEQQGLDLLDVNVSDESPQQFAEQEQQSSSRSNLSRSDVSEEEPPAITQHWVASGVDFYA